MIQLRNLMRVSPLMLLASCATASFAPVSVKRNYPARTPADQIEIYRTEKPEKKYQEIGTANFCCSNRVENSQDPLRKVAAENGGDAIINVQPYAGGGVSATIIRYQP